MDSIGVASLKTLIRWLQVTQKPLLPKPYCLKKNKKDHPLGGLYILIKFYPSYSMPLHHQQFPRFRW